LSTSCCSIMTSVLTVRCIGALLHTMQPGLGGPGASPCTRHSTRPVRRLPTKLGSTRRNDVLHWSGMPAGAMKNRQQHLACTKVVIEA
jgi:hypothetical protein